MQVPATGRRPTTPNAPELKRRLVWHGVLLFLLGLLGGTAVSVMANPRMGLSAHVGTVLNGTFIIALGAAWDVLDLSPRAQLAAFWLVVIGSYGGCLGLLLAAVLGTRDSTPIHGAAQSAGYWSEMLVNLTLTVPGIALLVGTALVLWGLGPRPRDAGPRALNAA
jgi:hydroxylaminobenzene mutase